MPGEINERIKKFRKQKKLTQGELAKKIGMKTSTYSQKEREGGISVEIALKIADALEIDPSLLIFNNDGADLDFSPIKPQVFTAKSPSTVIDQIYGRDDSNTTKSNPQGLSDRELDYILDATEKSVIDTLRSLSKPQRREVFEFINEIKERGR